MPVMIITCHYYLTDLRWELGPTRFIRGSHVAGRKPDRANAEDHLHGVPDQPLMVKAGDCVAFRSDVCKSHLPEPAPPVGCASHNAYKHNAFPIILSAFPRKMQ